MTTFRVIALAPLLLLLSICNEVAADATSVGAELDERQIIETCPASGYWQTVKTDDGRRSKRDFYARQIESSRGAPAHPPCRNASTIQTTNTQ